MGFQNSATITSHLIITARTTSFVDDVTVVRKALHEHIEIKCFYEGTSTLLIGNETVTVEAGDVVIINPYEFHATIDCGMPEQRGKYHLFMVPLDYFMSSNTGELDLRSLIFAEKKFFRSFFPKDNTLYRLLMRAVEEYEQKAHAYQTAILGLLMEVFVELLRRGLCKENPSATLGDAMRSYQLIEPALRHIRDNYAENITVEKLASLCQVSKHYFCRVFKTAMGKTAMDYLQDYRIAIADVMLGNVKSSISQVAASCGFENANYFSRCYKRHFGITPSKRRHLTKH